MRNLFVTVSILSLGLTACSQETTDQASPAKTNQLEEVAAELRTEARPALAAQSDVMPTPQQAPIPLAARPVILPVESVEPETRTPSTTEPQGRATMPEFTYSYDYKFEAPDEKLGALQDAHMAACDAMGEQQCRLANFSQDRNAAGGTTASLELYVISGKIRTLADHMTNLAKDFGGDRVEVNIVGTNTTQRLDQAQLRVTNLLAERERYQAIVDDRRSSRNDKKVAKQQLAILVPQINQHQRQLDNVASELGFTKMMIEYSSSSLFGPWLLYALILLLLAAIAGVVYRSQWGRVTAPLPA